MNIDINRISCSQYLDVLARVLTCLPQETSICVSQRMQSTRFSFTFCSTGIFDQFEAKPIAWNIHVFVYSLGGRNNVVHEKCKLLPYVVPANFTLTAIRIRAYLDLGDSQHSTATHTQNISSLTVPLCWAHVAVIGRIAWHQFQLDSSNHRDFVSLANSLGAIAAHCPPLPVEARRRCFNSASNNIVRENVLRLHSFHFLPENWRSADS